MAFKAEEAGKYTSFVVANGTSADCNICGFPVPKDLSVRTHICPNCGNVEDRDVNAAKNILRRAIIGQELPESTPVEMLVGASAKQEATLLVGW